MTVSELIKEARRLCLNGKTGVSVRDSAIRLSQGKKWAPHNITIEEIEGEIIND